MIAFLSNQLLINTTSGYGFHATASRPQSRSLSSDAHSRTSCGTKKYLSIFFFFHALRRHALRRHALRRHALRRHALRRHALRRHALRRHALRRHALRRHALRRTRPAATRIRRHVQLRLLVSRIRGSPILTFQSLAYGRQYSYPTNF